MYWWPLDHHNKTVRDLWNQEPQDIKDKIAAYRDHQDEKEQVGSQDEEGCPEDREGGVIENLKDKAKVKEHLCAAEMKAKEYNECQRGTTAALTPILKELHERMGYVGALVLAAPDGTRGGELSTIRHPNANLCSDVPPEPAPEAREALRLPAVSVHVTADDTPAASSRGTSQVPSCAAPSATTSCTQPASISHASSSSPAVGQKKQGEKITLDEDPDSDEDEDSSEDENRELEVDTEYKPWKNDRELTEEEIRNIEREKMPRDRERAYNMFRNKRELDKLGLAAMSRDLLSWAAKQNESGTESPQKTLAPPLDTAFPLPESTPQRSRSLAAQPGIPVSPRLSPKSPQFSQYLPSSPGNKHSQSTTVTQNFAATHSSCGAKLVVAENEEQEARELPRPLAESAKLWLPSDLSTEERRTGCDARLLEMELKFHVAQCDKSLNMIRAYLHTKLHLIHCRNKNSTGQHKATRSRTPLGCLTDRINMQSNKYTHARNSLMALGGLEEHADKFQALLPEHIMMDGEETPPDYEASHLMNLAGGGGPRAPKKVSTVLAGQAKWNVDEERCPSTPVFCAQMFLRR
ncbi:hypothetical protein HWV62_25985 [Athelia sp. TMB]|nr:hypothetical protein HWV62_25985 [Athelia sp. TMB]